MTTEQSDQPLTDYALSLLDNIWMKTEEYDKAIEVYSEYIGAHPGSGFAIHLLAIHFWYSSRYQQALEDYNRVLELAPNDPLILLGRGQVYVEMGQPFEAASDMEKSVSLLNQNPDNREPFWRDAQAYAHNGLGAALALVGDIPRAFQEFELSITLQPENGWVYFNRAKTMEKIGETSNALVDYKKSLACENPKLTPIKRAYAASKIGQLTP